MTQQATTHKNTPLILGTISILLTIIGLLIWATTTLAALNQPAGDQIGSDSNIVGDDRETPVIIVEEKPAVTDLNFLLPLFLTSFGAVTSFGALVIEWRKDKRDVQEDSLARKIQRLDLELKTLQLHKLRQEMADPPPADT